MVDHAYNHGQPRGVGNESYCGAARFWDADVQNSHGKAPLVLQCETSMFLQCPYSSLYVKRTVPLPYWGLEKEVGMILTLSQVG